MAVPEGSLGVVHIAKGCSQLAKNEVHMLPCCINYNGPAPVSDYFKPKIADSFLEGVEVKEAAFRGRKLLGCTTELPQDYCGLLLEKVIPAEDHKKEQKWNGDILAPDIWNAKVMFKDLTYWRHDDNPHFIDNGRKNLEWLRLASMIHKPVPAAEVTLMEQTELQKGSDASGKKRKLGQV